MLTYIIAWISTRIHNEEGQDLIEYALLGGLIAATLIAVATLAAYTGALQSMATGIGNCIDFNSTTTCEIG